MTVNVSALSVKNKPLNNLTPVKVTRRRKKLHIEWISCNSCNKWVHPKCTDLKKKETLNFKNLEQKVEHFFKSEVLLESR